MAGCTLDEILAELVRVSEDTAATEYQGRTYLPMHVGNRWEINEQNYTVIQDTLRLGGGLFYKFYSLIVREPL